MRNKRNKKKSWLEKKYGFKELPDNSSFKKVDKIFDHALERKKDRVLKEIILKFPEYHSNKSNNFVESINCRYPEFLEEAFKLGLHPDSGTSFLCLVFEYPELLKLGIKYGADLDKASWDNEVALGFASNWGNFESVKILVEAGANINAIEGAEHKYSPLDCARNHPEIEEYLISHGAKSYEELKQV